MTWVKVDTGPEWHANVVKNTDYKAPRDAAKWLGDYIPNNGNRTKEVDNFIKHIRAFMTNKVTQ